MPSLAASAVVAVVLVAGLSGHTTGSGATSIDASTVVATDSAGAEESTTVPEVVVVTDPAVPKSALAATVRLGSSGRDVSSVQQRLTDLGFAPGPVDGQFGAGTQQAVWAFEKLVMKTPRAAATGRVTNQLWQTMQDQIEVTPLRRGGAGSTHVEIYVPAQVLIVFADDHPRLIAHISTGEQDPSGAPHHWCETVRYDTGPNGEPLDEPVTKGVCADAKTPGGVFRFTRRYTGNRIGPLGGMFNPVYFNYGIAIHGARNVPLQPASHGCVRINETIAKYFPSLVANGDRVYVWGQDGREPEQYSRNDSLPSFNAPDPNATTTTSSTTTTTTTTTAPPTTTIATTTSSAAVTTVRPATTIRGAATSAPASTAPRPVPTAPTVKTTIPDETSPTATTVAATAPAPSP